MHIEWQTRFAHHIVDVAVDRDRMYQSHAMRCRNASLELFCKMAPIYMGIVHPLQYEINTQTTHYTLPISE